MSWHYSRALVAAYSEATCSDGAPSVPSNTNPTPQAYLSPDRMTAFSRLSRFGMTCEPLTVSLGAELLTWYLAAFPVRTYPAQERAQELTGNDQGSGAKWPGSLARYDHASRSWKTAQYSLLGGSVEYSETWPRWGTMRSGVCWERQTLALPTSGTGSGYWPTPNVPNGGRSCAHVTDWRGSTAYHNGKKVQVGLEHAVKYWPTPCATDHKGSGKTGDLRDRLDYAVERGATKSAMYATPQSRDFRTGEGHRWGDPKRSRNLNNQIAATFPTPLSQDAKHSGYAPSGPGQSDKLAYFVTRNPTNPRNGPPGVIQNGTTAGGQLNPTWVEWLMGWPLGWTDLKPLGTDKYLLWLQQHLRD